MKKYIQYIDTYEYIYNKYFLFFVQIDQVYLGAWKCHECQTLVCQYECAQTVATAQAHCLYEAFVSFWETH